jgi:hypothetical protein
MPTKIQTVIQASVQMNSFHAFPENVLLSMVADERPTVRKKGMLAYTQ